mgnify:CR=1 FL=1
MHRLMKKILEILDGTPAEYGIRSRGQSMAELALVTPILIVLIIPVTVYNIRRFGQEEAEK